MERNKLEDIEKYFSIDPVRVNYLINIGDKSGAFYVETPKVACTTIKRTLQFIELEGAADRMPKDVHNRGQSPLNSLANTNRLLTDYLADKQFFKFCFVRNPFTRILSAYLDKLVTNQWEKNLRAPQLGFDSQADITFLDFLRRIRDQEPAEMDIHWCPQVLLTGMEYIDYDFIGRFERLYDDFQGVLDKLSRITPAGLQRSLFTIQEGKFYKTAAADKLKDYYDEEATRILTEIYARDFELLSYSMDIPLTA